MVNYIARRVRRIWARTIAKPEKEPKIGRVICREITPRDLDGVADLLSKGFWRLSRDYWLGVLDTLTTHQTPEGYPKYGYMLENLVGSEGKAVGVLLTIFTARVINNEVRIFCNESSYYVEPWFRFYASILVKRGHRFKEVTYLDLTPSPKRWTTLEAQGYRRFNQGVYAAVPALSEHRVHAKVQRVTPSFSDDRLDRKEISLLAEHAGYDKCISVVCEHDGVVHPFVFVVRRLYGIPFAFLIYSRNQTDFLTLAGALGRFLMKRSIALVLFDVDAPVKGLPGRLLARYPKFWKGGEAPRLGDLSYTEIAMFGVI